MSQNDKFTTDGLSMLSCLSDNAYDKAVFTIAGASRILTKRWPNGQRLRTLLALATLVIRVEHVRSPLALLTDYATARGRGIECRHDPHTKGGTRGHNQHWFSKAEHTLVLLNEYREACSELEETMLTNLHQALRAVSEHLAMERYRLPSLCVNGPNRVTAFQVFNGLRTACRVDAFETGRLIDVLRQHLRDVQPSGAEAWHKLDTVLNAMVRQGISATRAWDWAAGPTPPEWQLAKFRVGQPLALTQSRAEQRPKVELATSKDKHHEEKVQRTAPESDKAGTPQRKGPLRAKPPLHRQDAQVHPAAAQCAGGGIHRSLTPQQAMTRSLQQRFEAMLRAKGSSKREATARVGDPCLPHHVMGYCHNGTYGCASVQDGRVRSYTHACPICLSYHPLKHCTA